MRTVAQAARDAAKIVAPPSVYSCYRTDVVRQTPRGVRRRRGATRHNLTTDTASGYTNRRDWQAKAMGMGPSFAFATATGTSTAVGATSLTNSGAAFPTAGQGLAGQLVVSGSRYGVIVSNTATVLTIDQWYDPASASGASASTPATGVYVILPGQNPAAWLAVTGGTTPTSASTTLNAEITTADFARAVGTYAHTAAASTYTLVHLWTATTTVTLNAEAVFGAANTTAGGVMPFGAAEPNPPVLISGDTAQNTITVTIN